MHVEAITISGECERNTVPREARCNSGVEHLTCEHGALSQINLRMKATAIEVAKILDELIIQIYMEGRNIIKPMISISEKLTLLMISFMVTKQVTKCELCITYFGKTDYQFWKH